MRGSAAAAHYYYMAVCATHHLGQVEYGEESVVEFPEGIPAFPAATRFILIEPPELTPLIYLQCLSNPSLCFLTIPADCLVPDYKLCVPEEELAALGGGEDYLRLAILTILEGNPPSANLMAPVVINRASRLGRQMIQTAGDYSFTHPLRAESKEEPTC